MRGVRLRLLRCQLWHQRSSGLMIVVQRPSLMMLKKLLRESYVVLHYALSGRLSVIGLGQD